MSDYVSREAAIEAVREKLGCETCNGSNVGVICTFCNVGEAILIIKNIPAADVEPVRYGRWEPGNQICPVCGEDKFKDLDADIWSDWTPPCCPNCGAKMFMGDNCG